MKKWKVVPALLAVLGLTFALTACGQKAKPTTSSRPLTGFYKEENSAEDGTDKPFYWYFKKDGTVLCCSPEVESTIATAMPNPGTGLPNAALGSPLAATSMS